MTIWAVLGSFCHGLVFFSLGMTVSFLHYRSRRIALARHLFWLGAFAFGEAFNAWYALVGRCLPEAQLLPDFVPPLLRALSYTFLLAFGVQTLLSEETYRKRFKTWFTLLLCAWLIPYLLAVVMLWSAWEPLIASAEVLSRYVLAFPGGVLSALGLRRQSYQSLDASLRRRIRPDLRLIEVTMAAYGVLNLVIISPLLGLWASPIAAQEIDAVWAGWIWALVGAGIAFGLGRSLIVIQNEIEQWVEGIERLQALAEDRERIGRELHDGIIQSIYAAGLLLESIQSMIPTDPERAQSQLGRVMDRLNHTIQDIRRYIFDLRSDMSDDDLRTGIERLLRDFHVNTLLETEFEVTGDPRPINSMARRRHIFQIVREALANTAKHARARWVSIQLHYGEESLDLTISDDGIGMEKLLISKGYGLRNIRERARLLDGTLRIESAPGAGVTYHLTVPYT
ncbi:MAG: sensor histidine kinase [Anaerolineae bacterium]